MQTIPWLCGCAWVLGRDVGEDLQVADPPSTLGGITLGRVKTSQVFL